MLDKIGPFHRVGIQHVRVIGQRRDLDACFTAKLFDRFRFFRTKAFNVDMRNTRIPTFGLPARPAGGFHAFKAVAAGIVYNVPKRKILQNSADKPKFHKNLLPAAAGVRTGKARRGLRPVAADHQCFC